ncbi:MAG TPA: hypothetical protein VJM31_02145 [Vicinamibacterales bacterium]|nr:hypothetical protein [Vicinamibacterales bacterium]
MDKQKPNPVNKRPVESRKGIKAGANSDAHEHQRTTGLEGKTDSGPEPEVHGREIPPQD